MAVVDLLAGVVVVVVAAEVAVGVVAESWKGDRRRDYIPQCLVPFRYDVLRSRLLHFNVGLPHGQPRTASCPIVILLYRFRV